MRRVAYRPRRKPLCAAKRGDPGAREKLVEAFMPRTAPVPWLYRATPTVQRQESSQQVVVGLLEAPRELPRADRPPRSLQQPGHTGEVELVARLGARHGRDGGERSPEQIGERLGLSGDRVRQIERRTRGKLAAGARHSRTSP